MDINSWEETWGTINWEADPEDEIKQKIKDFYHAGVDFNKGEDAHLSKAALEHYDVSNMTPLMYAVRYASMDVVDLLLDGGADMSVEDRNGDTALGYAALYGRTEIVKYLIKHGPKDFINRKDKRGQTILISAIVSKNLETIKALLKIEPKLIDEKDKKGNSVFRFAVEGGYAEQLKVLLAIKPEAADETYEYDRTLLHLIDHDEKNLEIVKILLDVNPELARKKEKSGCTPLHGAAVSGSLEMVKAMLDACPGIVNVQSNEGFTPLRFACSYEVAHELINRGADVNVRDRDGKTPLLHFVNCCRTDFIPIVKELIENGADVTVRDKEGMSAKKLAVYPETKKLLRNAKKIRRDYLNAHPEKRSSLQKRLDEVSERSTIRNLWEKGKNVFAAMFSRQK